MFPSQLTCDTFIAVNRYEPLLKFLTEPVPQAVLWTSVLSVVVAVGCFIVQRFRDGAEENEVSASDLLTNFEEMHREGDLNESEYRTIKTALGAKLQKQLKDSDNKG